ncbi:unnamed protein product [Miscanthus lutarioriparius]|uniref:non-specific serine/threonine protein kinase n=1 Tax=Miscanthus lutarioriparius TaxID=422564 RepID=A0A811NY25_9POAL|nr:unnamed protein product [Miscanthus lutarioriparius]
MRRCDPFYLSDETADVLGNNSSCGYPGLDIDCVDDKYPILQLGGGPDYSYNVTGIDYTNSTISLADPDVLDGDESCPVDHNVTVPPAVWLNLLPESGYLLFFANCSISTIPGQPYINPITCPSSLDGYYSFVIPSDSEVPQQTLSRECKQVIQVPVLQNASLTIDSQWSTNGYRNALKQGFQLGWNSSRKSDLCTNCEGSNGRGAYNRYGEFVACLCTNGQVSNHECTKGSKGKTAIIVGIVAGTLFLCLGILIFFSARKYAWLPLKSKDEPRIESFLQKNGNIHPKRYTYANVKRMTKSFAVKLGQGGFGAVYRGNLHDGRQVAVKMLKDTKGDGEEFMNEVASISRTSHINVVTLFGFCLQGSKRALIYEYMPNGSLERYAFNRNMNSENLLSWEKLFDIAIGTARGLEYLHRGCNTRIVHFDIKPHNILLDQDFCPKISDFGLAKLCLNKESAISIAGARGTIGYIAPEVYSKQFGLVSSKSDVYSYGMMVLEMVGARDKNTSENSESSSQYFPQWIYEHLDDYCISASEIDGETTELVRKMIVVDQNRDAQFLKILELRTRDDRCPAVSHNVSFDELWLYNSSAFHNLTFFFGCHLGDSMTLEFDAYKIKCADFKSPPDAGPGDSFVVMTDEHDRYPEQELAMNCNMIVTVPVNHGVLMAASNQQDFRSGGYGDVLKRGFELEWERVTADGCHLCEESNGHCAYSQHSEFLGCLCHGGKAGSPDCEHIVPATASTATASRTRSQWRCPFYLSDETADVLGNANSSCGYPGLAIDCVDDEYPILQLGSGPDYYYNVTGVKPSTTPTPPSPSPTPMSSSPR